MAENSSEAKPVSPGKRLGVGVALVVLPAVGFLFVKNSTGLGFADFFEHRFIFSVAVVVLVVIGLATIVASIVKGLGSSGDR